MCRTKLGEMFKKTALLWTTARNKPLSKVKALKYTSKYTSVNNLQVKGRGEERGVFLKLITKNCTLGPESQARCILYALLARHYLFISQPCKRSRCRSCTGRFPL